MSGGFFVKAQPAGLPPFLQDEQGIAFEESFGATKDDALDLLKEAVKCRWPDPNRPDALPYIGRNVRILRAPPESDIRYAARLLTAPDLWQWGGTPTGISDIFSPYSYTVTQRDETAPSWQLGASYNNGDYALANGNVYQQAAPNGSLSGAVPPSGQGGAGGGAVPQADSFVDGQCLWNWARDAYGTVVVVPNHDVILEGALEWFSRFIVLCSRGYWTSDGVWDQGVFVGGVNLNFTVPNVGAETTFFAGFSPANWPPDGSIIEISTAGFFVFVSQTANTATILNAGYPGTVAPGTVIAAPQSVTWIPDVWDGDDALWDSSMTVADADYLRASVREKKSDGAYPCLLGIVLADQGGDGLWGLTTDVYDIPNAVWDDNTADVTYLSFGEFWGQEVYFGGTPLWDDPGDVWGDYVAPSGGWHLRN